MGHYEILHYVDSNGRVQRGEAVRLDSLTRPNGVRAAVWVLKLATGDRSPHSRLIRAFRDCGYNARTLVHTDRGMHVVGWEKGGR